MPDKRTHRGKHPEDERLFAPRHLDALRTAVAEFSWLLTRGYAHDSALKLVGDRHDLTVRQRTAVMRSACTDQALAGRRQRCISPADARNQSLGIDGYNLLITIESALSGGMILVGRDGCYRDLASIHGTYRRVEETLPAMELIADALARMDPSRIDWYLDRPVSNSGRLKALIADLLEDRAARSIADATWNIELVNNPDKILATYGAPVVTSDSVVLDECGPWLNLAAEIIDTATPSAWKVDLRPA